jgi:hypothetical protein
VNPDLISTRQSTRIEPEPAWTVQSEAPLKGLALAREAGILLAWDEGDQLALIDLNGDHRAVTRAPGKILLATISDDGSRIALVTEGPRLFLLDADLGTLHDRPAPSEPLGMAIDPHGRYVVISSRMSINHIYTRHGKPAGKFEANQALAFLAFVPDRPVLLAAASYGLLGAFEIEGNAGKLDLDVLWQDRQIANVGRLTTSGDGSIVLASCFTHGIQRYNVLGENEGAYHLGGTCTHAVPDFAGRTIAVATLEGELAILNASGNVRWKTGLPRPAIALEVDPMGRFVVYGNATGEIVRLDLYASDNPRPRPRSASKAGSASAQVNVGTVRTPAWTSVVAASEDQAETAVIAVLDEPGRVAVFSGSLRVQVFAHDGQNLGFAPEILGVGRILRTAPGWIAAATDRNILLFQAARNSAQRVDLSLVEVTHLAVRPDTFGLAIVQERDRLGRATIAGRWIWRHELKSPIEDLAIGPEGCSAITNDLGQLLVYDPAGTVLGTYQADPSEALMLIEAVDQAKGGVVWMTVARRSQVLRGHDLKGRVLWESPVAWEAWQFVRLGSLAVLSAPDGRAQAFDGSGHLRGQSKASAGGKDLFALSRKGEPRRISPRGEHLICSDFDGRVRWRAVCDAPLGPVAAGRDGVAALIGRSLAWFPGLD